MIRCSSQDCESEAFWLPALVMRPVGGEGLARAEIDLPLCHRHKQVITLKDVLTDEGWESMANYFAAQGKLMPDRESILLDFKHMENGYYC